MKSFKVFVRGMEPKGIFPTVTLDIDTWNQESDQIVKWCCWQWCWRHYSFPPSVTIIDVTFENLVSYFWFTRKIQIIHTKMNSTKCQIEFLVNSESFFEFEVDCLKSMKNNKVFLAGSEENAEPYPGEIRSVFIRFFEF